MIEIWVFVEEFIGLTPNYFLGNWIELVNTINRTFLTTGKTHGFALSSLYAPIPRSTFLSDVSFRYAAINPKSGSSAACGTTSAVKTEGG